ncbi:MAG: histidine phosphatase family protein [Oscillospiraceae bacterium]
MICYLVRHGRDDDSVRGGWSDHGLTPLGVEQVRALAREMAASQIDVGCIYSSDLRRARETAAILSDQLHIPVVYDPGFREADNGDLAGMKNELASQRFPGLYWSALAYTERYPNGESPELFFRRVQYAWTELKRNVSARSAKDVLLVTHGGVMEAILCIENGVEFSNKTRHFSTPNAKPIPVAIR